jgi:hypothetical protein
LSETRIATKRLTTEAVAKYSKFANPTPKLERYRNGKSGGMRVLSNRRIGVGLSEQKITTTTLNAEASAKYSKFANPTPKLKRYRN